MHDFLQRFMLRGAPVRGEYVSLDASWREVVTRHPGVGPALSQLGEVTAAGLLLAATLKFDGKLILQIHGDGPVSLLVVECDAAGMFRATLETREPAAPLPPGLRAQVNAHGKGRCVVTLDPPRRQPGEQPYQGIVPLDGERVSAILEGYMQRSEQLATRLWLAADGQRACGLLLQRLPDDGGDAGAHGDAEGWERLLHLAGTLDAPEMLATPGQTLVRRLFWNEPLHAIEHRDCRFACRCSRRKVAAMLEMLGRDEVESIIAEQGRIAVRCEYCKQPYEFDRVDGVGLFTGIAPVTGGERLH